jgi:heat shock protein beta
VSRETLQNHRFLRQLQRILVKKAIDLFTKLASDEPEQYKEVSKQYGNALRIGMLESQKDKIKLAKLLRFESTRSDYTSLEEVSQSCWHCLTLTFSTSTTARRVRNRSVIFLDRNVER